MIHVIEAVGVVLTLLQIYLYGKIPRTLWAPGIGVIQVAPWAIFAVYHSAWFLLFMNVVMFILHAKNFWMWYYEKRNRVY